MKLTKEQRRKIYLAAAKSVNRYRGFMCTAIKDFTGRMPKEKSFPELFLFKEIDDYTWATTQTQTQFPELTEKRFEIRENILLLCAEICKP